jgi:hypothetical protein
MRGVSLVVRPMKATGTPSKFLMSYAGNRVFPVDFSMTFAAR